MTGTFARNQQYQFTELHFHWNGYDTKGSEHGVNGQKKALEMHLVHFNTRYRTKEEASSQPDGILVLGVLFHEDTVENPTLDPIVDQLEYVRRTDSSAPARKSFTLKSLLPPDTDIFYMYRGSLTTPPCSESVIWIIIAEVQKVGYAQLGEFQKISRFSDRTRDLQPLNQRTVYASSDDHCRRDSNQGYGSGSSNSGYGNSATSSGYGNTDSGYGSSSNNNNNAGYGNNNGYGRPPVNDGYGSQSGSSGSTSGSGYGNSGSSSSDYRPPVSNSGQNWNQKPQSSYGTNSNQGYGSSNSDGYGSSGNEGSSSGYGTSGGTGYGYENPNRPGSGYNSNTGSYRPSSGSEFGPRQSGTQSDSRRRNASTQ